LDSISWISDHIDCFVSQSRGNQSVDEVCLFPHAFNGHDDAFWEKVGQAVGNLQGLETIFISTERENDDGADALIPNWGRLADLLSHVRQKVKVKLDSNPWTMGEVQALTRALSHARPSITSFNTCYALSYKSLDALYPALATLPALESVWFVATEARKANESALANPESLTKLLRAPSLRTVRFSSFHFTTALSSAIANA
jgi:hypothetical protein